MGQETVPKKRVQLRESVSQEEDRGHPRPLSYFSPTSESIHVSQVSLLHYSPLVLRIFSWMLCILCPYLFVFVYKNVGFVVFLTFTSFGKCFHRENRCSLPTPFTVTTPPTLCLVTTAFVLAVFIFILIFFLTFFIAHISRSVSSSPVLPRITSISTAELRQSLFPNLIWQYIDECVMI